MLDFPDLIPECGDVMSFDEWRAAIEYYSLTPWDGTAYYVRGDHMRRSGPDPFREACDEATGVICFNK